MHAHCSSRQPCGTTGSTKACTGNSCKGGCQGTVHQGPAVQHSEVDAPEMRAHQGFDHLDIWVEELVRRNASSPGLDHLVFLGEVDPQLEAPQIAFRHLGHFAVNNAPPCCHPLYSSRTYHALQSLVLGKVNVIQGDSLRAFHCAQCHDLLSFTALLLAQSRPANTFPDQNHCHPEGIA